MKNLTPFICAKHGPASLQINEREPTCCHKFEIRCKSCGNKFLAWVSPRQVNELLTLHSSIETKTYEQDSTTEFEKRFGRKP